MSPTTSRNHSPHRFRRTTWFSLLILIVSVQACSLGHLAGYMMHPNDPEYNDGTKVFMQALTTPVAATRRADGLWQISATSATDLHFVLGYLQARDRMFQMDLFRRLATGHAAEILGNAKLGTRTILESDLFSRFMNFGGDAEKLWQGADAAERRDVQAFSDGINYWIDSGKRSLEHRLLAVTEVEHWRPVDSLAIYRFVMFGLSSNYNREIRRLVVACAAGLEAMARIWPVDIDFGITALPPEFVSTAVHGLQPAIVPEIADELAGLCPARNVQDLDRAQEHNAHALLAPSLAAMVEGWESSNNWALDGSWTRSTKPLFANDPHIPHMNPPMVWGLDRSLNGQREVGFTFPGLHRVVFGHNGKIAWGATTNHVDRQDLVVQRPVGNDSYMKDGQVIRFMERSETFKVRGAGTTTVTVRFTADGPLLNDLDHFLQNRIPLTALRTTPVAHTGGHDLIAARAMNEAQNAAQFAAAVTGMDAGCVNWVYADNSGNIGYRSPCIAPIRKGYKGTFPVAGWLSKYDWQGFYDKQDLPYADTPHRGWIATANSRIIPENSFPTAWNNDSTPPARYSRVVSLIKSTGTRVHTMADSQKMQLDIQNAGWHKIRSRTDFSLCRDAYTISVPSVEHVRRILCSWDGSMDTDSVGATIFVFFTHAVLDASLADELPLRDRAALWHYVQSLLQFEANVSWLWQRDTTDPVWDNRDTEIVETFGIIMEQALHAATQTLIERYGDNTENWQWGTIRPFVLQHPFGSKNNLLGKLFNSEKLPGVGGVSTLNKHHFHRSDRNRMQVAVGAVFRFVVDMADPWSAEYSLAGGQSGWPGSPWYGNLLHNWHYGKYLKLSPRPSAGDRHIKFLPETEGD